MNVRRRVLKKKGQKSAGEERKANVDETKYGKMRGREIRKATPHIVQNFTRPCSFAFSSLPRAALNWLPKGSSRVINFNSMPDCLATKF